MANASTGLRRRLNLFDVTCIGVNAIVGSGVFALPDDMQRAMGGWSPLAFLLCAVLLMPVALCFAELAGRHTETGGSFLYARNAFGPRVGFFVGWFCWANTFVSWAANMTLFVELISSPQVGLFESRPEPYVYKLIAVAGIVGLGAINYFGVKPGAWVVNLVVIGKLSAIFCFLAVAILAFDPSKLGGPLPYGIAGVGQGIYLALFPLQGFEVTPITAGETKNPQRTVPLGTLGALLFSALLFVLVQSTLATTYPGIANVSQRPLADGARYLGPTLGLIVLIGSMVSIGGFTAGSALGSPRYAQAIAAHGLLPAPIASLHERWGTPHIAILLTTAFTAVLATFLDYRQLVGMSNITIVVQYLFTCLAVPAIRRKQGPPPPKTFVIPGGPLIPIIGAAGSLTFLYGPIGGLLRLESESILEVAFALGTLVLGILVATLYARSQPRSRQSAGGPRQE
jgi:amino acid transporter